jgi:uncharacterized oligopeptide transporter (OPT) family protein
MHTMKNRFKNLVSKLAKDRSGEAFVDMALKILIVVVIGAAILAIMNAAMPGLFQGLIDKISSQLTGITILP